MLRNRILALCLFLYLPVAWAESAQPPNVEAATITGDALKGSRKALVLVPPGYERSPNRYPVLYLLHGHGGNYEDWLKKTNLSAYAGTYPLIIVMPDGENSWYTNSATRPEYRYEDFMVKELIGYVDSRYRTIADRHRRAIAGLSMGGFGAMKLGLKFPQLFSAVGSLSGALGLAQAGVNISSNTAVMKSIGEAFGPADHEAHTANDPFAIAQKLGAQRPAIYFDCGGSDPLLPSNRKFAELLASQKIPYEYREPIGAHNWEYWDRQIQEYLRWLGREWRLSPGPMGAPMPAPMTAGPPPGAPPPRR